MIRRGGRQSPLEPASWEEALTFVATRLATIRADHGLDSIGMISSAGRLSEAAIPVLLVEPREELQIAADTRKGLEMY